MISIIDYGMGNIHSVQKAFQVHGARAVVTNSPATVGDCNKLVLPGVGAFGDAMQELKKRGLIPAIKKHIMQGKTFLGICLGMQLLFEASKESPDCRGLGILEGTVEKFRAKAGLKVPHIGWNQLRVARSQSHKVTRRCPLLQNIPDNAYVYFCHSYYVAPRPKDLIAATTNYGLDFASLLWKGNIYGMQFHPEKSQKVGLRIIKNFVDL
jgi:glutamine amidotransferase